MARGYACFHHCNDLDRPSVAQCNVCGKALCAECVKVLRSKKTGKMLCVECRNQEIQKDENLAAQISIRLKQEMKRMKKSENK